VLLCCVQHHVQPHSTQALPRTCPVVNSWLQHFEACWGQVLPQHLLLPVAAAIEAAGGLSVPREQDILTMDCGSTARACLMLVPKDCMESAPAIAASTGIAAASGDVHKGSGAGSGSGSGIGSGSESESESGSSSGWVETELCSGCVEAASRVLGLCGSQPVCQLSPYSRGMERAPLLLLASAVAALYLEGRAALPVACACCQTAGTRVASMW
jgi:hypothetical protein